MPTETDLKKRFTQEDDEAITSTIQALSQHKQGRKFLWWLLQIGGVGQQPFANNALQTSFNCGTLNVGNRILAEVTEATPDGYLLMMKESADERRTRDTELRAAGRSDARDDTDT